MKLLSLLFILSIFLSPDIKMSGEESPKPLSSPIKAYHQELTLSLQADLQKYSTDPAVGTCIQELDWKAIYDLLAVLEQDHSLKEIVIAGQKHTSPMRAGSNAALETEIKQSQDAIQSVLVSIGKDIDIVMVEGFSGEIMLSKQSIVDIVKYEPVYDLTQGWSYNILDGEKRFNQAKISNAVYRLIDSKNPGHSFYGAEETSLHRLDVTIKLMAYHFANPGYTQDYFLEMDSLVGNKIRTMRSLVMLANTVKKMNQTNNTQAILIVGKNHGFDFYSIEQQGLLPYIQFKSFTVQ